MISYEKQFVRSNKRGAPSKWAWHSKVENQSHLNQEICLCFVSMSFVYKTPKTLGWPWLTLRKRCLKTPPGRLGGRRSADTRGLERYGTNSRLLRQPRLFVWLGFSTANAEAFWVFNAKTLGKYESKKNTWKSLGNYQINTELGNH